MVSAKRPEMSMAGENLGMALRELRVKITEGASEGLEKLHTAVAAWETYERRVQEAQEWPYNANVLPRLGASALFPASFTC